MLVFSVIVSVWVLCLFFSKPSSKLYILDKPNERSLHEVPKPRSGGIAIFISILTAWICGLLLHDVDNFIYYLIVGLILLLLVSYIDDKYSIMQIWRLLVHVLVASILVIGVVDVISGFELLGISNEIHLVVKVIAILFIVWCINLYNFMDGIDGLAGGMGFIGFCSLAWFGWRASNDLFLLFASVVAAANLGFLLHNFPPAKIFMGDVGSIGMGYLVAFFSLWGLQENIFKWWAPILIFSPFFVDATVTIIRRSLAGEKVWQAHKTHNYQKLVRMGWGHRKTVLYGYMLMIAVSCTAMVMQFVDSKNLNIFLLLVWLCIYALMIFFINLSFSRVSKIT